MRYRPIDARTNYHSSLSALRAAWFYSMIVSESEMPFSGTVSKPLDAGDMTDKSEWRGMQFQDEALFRRNTLCIPRKRNEVLGRQACQTPQAVVLSASNTRVGKALVLFGHGESMAPAAQDHSQQSVSMPERPTDTRSLWVAAEFSGWCPPPRRGSLRSKCFFIGASDFRSFSTSKPFLPRRSCLDDDEGENPMRCRTKPDISK